MLWFDRGGLEPDQYAGLAESLGVKRPRVLAWARTEDGVVVGLPDKLAVLRDGEWTFISWADIVHGGWDQRSLLLRWTTDARAEEVRIEDPQAMPGLFRERVQSSIVVSRDVKVSGLERPAVVSARRDPGSRDPEIVWRIEPATHADPEVRARLEATLASVRDQLGLQ